MLRERALAVGSGVEWSGGWAGVESGWRGGFRLTDCMDTSMQLIHTGERGSKTQAEESVFERAIAPQVLDMKTAIMQDGRQAGREQEKTNSNKLKALLCATPQL
jgi:hypothetical protein